MAGKPIGWGLGRISLSKKKKKKEKKKNNKKKKKKEERDSKPLIKI